MKFSLIETPELLSADRTRRKTAGFFVSAGRKNRWFLVSVMCYRLLLICCLLGCCSGESSVLGPPEKVLAFAGDDVVLPCSFNATHTDDFPTVEWSKEGLDPNVVFLYRDGCETYEMKNPTFHYRTSFVTEELKNRNISLRISNVQRSDAGKYRCLRLWRNAPRDETTVELVVGASSEPKLSVTSAESGGVTLHCDATCWLPEPEIQFVDDRGNNITADEPRRRREASGCYTVTRRATLNAATNSVTCRVHQPQINRTRSTEILIPVGCMKSCSQPVIIAAGVAFFLPLVSCGLTVLLWRRCGRSAGEQKLPVSRQSSDQSTVSNASDNRLLLRSIRADRAGNDTIEKLKKEVADLKSKLHEKDETIRQLQTNINKPSLSPIVSFHDQPTISPVASTDSNPPKSANVAQHPGPKPGTSRQRGNQAPGRTTQRIPRIKSSPAVLDLNATASPTSSSSSPSKEKLDHFEQMLRESSGPKAAKPQRRHSSAFPSSTLSKNRFSLLADLKEESELLVPIKKTG